MPAGGGEAVIADFSGVCPQDGKTPLQLALEHGEAAAAQVLREAGAAE